MTYLHSTHGFYTSALTTRMKYFVNNTMEEQNTLKYSCGSNGF